MRCGHYQVIKQELIRKLVVFKKTSNDILFFLINTLSENDLNKSFNFFLSEMIEEIEKSLIWICLFNMRGTIVNFDLVFIFYKSKPILTDV